MGIIGVDGKCLTKCVVYKATVTETDIKEQETYIGLTENEFKTRFKWEIIKNVKPYAPGEKICKLCLREKFSIVMSKPSLNKRTEIFGHIVHRKQFLLNNIKEQYTPPASQQQQWKYSINQQLSRLKKELKQKCQIKLKLRQSDSEDLQNKVVVYPTCNKKSFKKIDHER